MRSRCDTRTPWHRRIVPAAGLSLAGLWAVPAAASCGMCDVFGPTFSVMAYQDEDLATQDDTPEVGDDEAAQAQTDDAPRRAAAPS